MARQKSKINCQNNRNIHEVLGLIPCRKIAVANALVLRLQVLVTNPMNTENSLHHG